MKKAIFVALGVVTLGMGAALAQPAPSPSPTPEKGSGGNPIKTDEKTETNESLQGGDRPWANGVSAEQQQIALAAFREGNEQLNDGLFVEAVKKYREALKSWSHPAIHYNMALALMNLDQPIEVYESLQQAIKFGPAPLEKDKFEHAKEYLLLVEKQIAEVEVTCKKEGAKVSVDNKEVFTVKKGEVGVFRGRVRIGKHTFVAEKPGYNAQVNAPFIGPGEKFRIELELYTAEELTRYKRRWNARWVPYAVIGGGVLAGVGGWALHQSAQSSYDQFDQMISECNEMSQNGGCDATMPGITKFRDSGDSKLTMGYVGYGIAGAAVVTGAILLILNREQAYQITADQYRREHSGAVSVTPYVAPGMAGAALSTRF